MRRYTETVLQPDGKPLVGASVLVTLTGTSTAAALFDNASGSLSKANPLATDSSGAFAFYAADGRYDLTISKAGFAPILVSDVLLDDPADASAATFSSVAVRETGVAAAMGVATLVAGQVTVPTTAIKATSRVFLSVQAAAGVQGHLRVDSRAARLSFVIASSSGTDTSTVAWLIVDPAA